MTIPQRLKNDLFERTLSAFAMLGSLILVFIAGSQPPGTRGETIVAGHMFLVCCLVAALALRGAYEMGAAHTRKFLDSGSRRSLHA